MARAPTPGFIPRHICDCEVCVSRRICANCAWYGYGGKCHRPNTFDVVNGHYSLQLAASSERNPRFLWFGKDRCGPEGKFFEQAETRR